MADISEPMSAKGGRFEISFANMASNPRFQPRDWVDTRKDFGSNENIEWLTSPRKKPKLPAPDASRPPNELALEEQTRRRQELDQLGAARRQHELARAIRQAMKVRGFYTITAYAAAYELNYKRLNTILNGTAIMRLEDVANAERNLRVKLLWAREPNGPSSPASA
jgi:hypothetical protein